MGRSGEQASPLEKPSGKAGCAKELKKHWDQGEVKANPNKSHPAEEQE